MCELNAYVSEEGGDRLFLENVDTVRLEGGKVFLRNLFGEEKVFEGLLKEISLKKGRVILGPCR
ncbi:MAG: CooT family nickel-binding protein [Thermodesulfovibrionales bacterium]|nr:CooT family nickel-binding protein [Thermodesulfovibrionales bacterium]